jgi:cyclopropane-fatty-acyl-phospholipid synthase
MVNQNPPELVAHRESTAIGSNPSRQQAFLSRLWSLLKLGISHGPVYAIAIARMTSSAQHDPEANWMFWTRRRSPFLDGILHAYPGVRRRRRLLDKMLTQGHAEGIEFHYDVSNDFFRLFLDQDYMFYTCARFLSEGEGLAQAQKNKADLLLGMLDPEPGQQILDLGLGWGGMMRRISEATGSRDGLRGYTLSKQQIAYVTELGFDVELQDFIEKDYAPDSLDRVISIGSLEHVRPAELLPFYNKIFHALRPGGRMVNQFFSLDREPFPLSMVWCQMFFPGTLLAMHDVHVQAARKAGFVIKEDVPDSYKKTLRAWYDNLVSHRAEAIAAAGIHIYNEYMTFFPLAWRFFDDGEATLHRMLLIKP